MHAHDSLPRGRFPTALTALPTPRAAGLRMGWRRGGQSVVLGVILLSIFLHPSQVLAHARVVRSDPVDRAELVSSPRQIELWFNERLEAGFNTLGVYAREQLQSSQRANFVEGDPKLDVKDPTHLTIKLKSLSPGDYVVEWRVLSRDGHSAPGRFSFRVLDPKAQK